jgi:hypothetical protein
MSVHSGGCLCGGLRYETTGEPVRVTICHCRFCQRATGAGHMVEPIFTLENFRLVRGTPHVYAHVSGGSGKQVYVHFCKACGTKLWLSFERFVGVAGVYAGTFDEPDWFEITPANAKQIFTCHARTDAVLLPHIPVYAEHAMTNEGVALPAMIYDAPHRRGRRG